MLYRIAAVFALPILLLALPAVSQCPSYTHKDDVIAGSPAGLPDGWFVYGKNGQTGLYRSSVRSFSETTIAGTTSDRPAAIDISPDGQWIVYLSSNDLYLVRSSGGSRTRVPHRFFNVASLAMVWTGFHRNSPNGIGVFYPDYNWQGKSYLCAIPVTLSGGAPSFGSARIIATTDSPLNAQHNFTLRVQSGSCAVWGDQIFGLFDYNTGRNLNGFLVIPDGGAGNATYADFYQFTTQPAKDYWGCGQTMSHDGQYCASNSNGVGDPDCVPTQQSTPPYDHKGFYITRFLRSPMPPIAISDQIDDPLYGVSSNWCPVAYRLGTYDEVEYTDWNFSNSNEYLIGVSRGSRIASFGLSFGVWMVHWSTNTWSQLTPPTTSVQYKEPAVYFPGIQSAEHPRRSRSARLGVARSGGRILTISPRTAITLEHGEEGLTMYDINGRAVWRYVRAHYGSSQKIDVPHHVRSATFVVRFE